MKRTIRATALLLASVLLLFSLASCEGNGGVSEAKAVFDAMAQTFRVSAISQTKAFGIAERSLRDGSLSLSYTAPTLTKAEAKDASLWSVSFREGRPAHLSFLQGERDAALWWEGERVIARPFGADPVGTDLSKLPALPVGTLGEDTEAAEGTLAFLRLSRDLITASAPDETLSDRLAEAVQNNASVTGSADEEGQHYSFLFSEVTIGALFADISQIAKGNAALRAALTAFLEHLYEAEEMELPEDLFSDGGVARVKEDLKQNGSLSLLAKFTLKDGVIKGLRCVLRKNQTEIFHMSLSLSDLENGTAEIFSITRSETTDQKISWSCEHSGDFSIHTLRVAERTPGETEYSPKLSLETQYNEKQGTLSGGVTMGGLLGLEFMGALTVEEDTLRFSCDQFRLHYGFLSHSFSANVDLTLSTAPTETQKAPEETREWTELDAEELREVYQGLYPILRPEREENENPFEDLIPDFEDILEGILPIEY